MKSRNFLQATIATALSLIGIKGVEAQPKEVEFKILGGEISYGSEKINITSASFTRTGTGEYYVELDEAHKKFIKRSSWRCRYEKTGFPQVHSRASIRYNSS